MRTSRIGTICLGLIWVLLAFQNCAAVPETPQLTTDRNTVQSLTSEKSALEEETLRIRDLIAADLQCAVDSDCEKFTLTAACASVVASSRRRADRDEVIDLILQHRADWRAFANRAAAHAELAWVCKQGEAAQRAVCSTAGRCGLIADE